MGSVSIKPGDKFSRLVVIRRDGVDNTKKNAMWLCECACGTLTRVSSCNLKNHHTTSCGCFHKENIRNLQTTHNRSNSDTYKIWQSMKKRCCNLEDVNYGGRGIKVCDRWLESFQNFYDDMGDRPSKDHSLDRIDNDGDYCPENCRWASSKQQSRNRRNNKVYEYKGKVLTLVEWVEMQGIPYGTAQMRLSRGWPFEQALEFEPRHK